MRVSLDHSFALRGDCKSSSTFLAIQLNDEKDIVYPFGERSLNGYTMVRNHTSERFAIGRSVNFELGRGMP
jgi:hypothetical protein